MVDSRCMVRAGMLDRISVSAAFRSLKLGLGLKLISTLMSLPCLMYGPIEHVNPSALNLYNSRRLYIFIDLYPYSYNGLFITR